MGCKLSKLFSSFQTHDQLSEEDANEAPKVYSWDKRDKVVDVKNFMLDQLSNETVTRMPGSINGQQFIIQNCNSCDIYVLDHCATVTVDDCTNCKIFIGAIKTSIFVRDCNNCVVVTCCQQFRTRDCKKLEVFLCCVTQPIIEATTAVRFGCFQFNYLGLENHLTAAGLSPYNNNWTSIHDFTPVPGENNYSYISIKATVKDYLPIPDTEPLSSVSISTDSRDSIIPWTVGVKQRPPGEGCLVSVFHCNLQTKLAAEIVGKLRALTLVQTAEVNVNEYQVKKVYGSDKYSAKVCSMW